MDLVWSGNNAWNAQIEFQNAKKALIAANISEVSLDQSCLTQSYLRLEALLSLNLNNYALNVQANQQNNGAAVRPTEVRLNLQDAFYASGVSMWVAKPASATDYAIQPHSYPSPVVFTSTGTAAALYALYNGYMSINVNNDVIMTRYPLMNFLNVPQTQLTAATNSPLDAFAGADRLAFQPNPVFIGQNNSVVTLHLPASLTAVETTSYVILEFQGVLAQNVTTLVAPR